MLSPNSRSRMLKKYLNYIGLSILIILVLLTLLGSLIAPYYRQSEILKELDQKIKPHVIWGESRLPKWAPSEFRKFMTSATWINTLPEITRDPLVQTIPAVLTEHEAKKLATFPFPVGLVLRQPEKVELLQLFQDNRNFNEIRLYLWDIDDAYLDSVEKIVHCQHLHLISSAGVTDEGLAGFLDRSPQLRFLLLKKQPKPGPKTREAMSKHGVLQSIKLIQTGFDEAEFLSILQLPMEKIAFIDEPACTDAVLNAAASCKTLKLFTVLKTGVTEEGIRKLNQLRPEMSIISDYGTFTLLGFVPPVHVIP